MLKTLTALILGGALGAISRWGLHILIDSRWGSGQIFPWGIFVVNVVGCFLFGLFFSLFEGRPWFTSNLQIGIFTGFLGSFTTFSTFSWNTLELLRSGHAAMAVGNVGASVVIGLLAVWAGFAIGR